MRAQKAKAMDGRAAIHQRLLALARQSELQRFTRALAALEALHTNELHEQMRSAQHCTEKADRANAISQTVQHKSAAQLAKLEFRIATLESEAAQREQTIAVREEECEAVTLRAINAEQRARCTEATLALECVASFEPAKLDSRSLPLS